MNKIIYFGFFIFLFLFWSCAPERKFQDNRFYSSIPRMLAEIGSEFSYIDSGSYKTKTKFEQSDFDYYFFASTIDKKIINRGIIILIGKVWIPSEYYFHATIFDEKDSCLCDHSMKLLAGESYESAIMNQQCGYIPSFQQLLRHKGYVLPDCKLHMILLKIIDDREVIYDGISNSRDTRSSWIKQIIYFENATTEGSNCKQWDNMKKLTASQKKYLHEFINRADKAIQFY